MAKTNTTELDSSYYPPRARWYSGIFYPLLAARRVLHLEKLHLPGALSPFQFVLSLVIPGFAFLALGRRMLGRSFLMGYCLAALVFVAALGYTAGNIGYGLMISAHATSIVFLLGQWLRDSGFGFRLVMALGTLLVVWQLIYSPLVGFVESRWIKPMRVGNEVIVVWRGAKPESVKRGDWVSYEISGRGVTGVYLQTGFGMDPVLAQAGDRVRFTKQTVFVNDKAFPLAPHMPVQGDLVVPEKQWFIWPTLDINRRGAVAEANISVAMQHIAMVSENQFIGTAFKHWFGRRQLP